VRAVTGVQGAVREGRGVRLIVKVNDRDRGSIQSSAQIDGRSDGSTTIRQMRGCGRSQSEQRGEGSGQPRHLEGGCRPPSHLWCIGVIPAPP
jgi:hypothetical protein